MSLLKSLLKLLKTIDDNQCASKDKYCCDICQKAFNMSCDYYISNIHNKNNKKNNENIIDF